MFGFSPCLSALCSSARAQKEQFCSSGAQHKKNLFTEVIILHEMDRAVSLTLGTPWLTVRLFSY
jgi:hypothetical protein